MGAKGPETAAQVGRTVVGGRLVPRSGWWRPLLADVGTLAGLPCSPSEPPGLPVQGLGPLSRVVFDGLSQDPRTDPSMRDWNPRVLVLYDLASSSQPDLLSGLRGWHEYSRSLTVWVWGPAGFLAAQPLWPLGLA